MTRKKNKKTLNLMSSIKEDAFDNLKEEKNDNLEEEKNDNLKEEKNDNLKEEKNDNLEEETPDSLNYEIKDLDILFYKNQNSNLILKIIELEKTIENLNEKLENLNDKNKKIKMLNILKEHEIKETTNEIVKTTDEIKIDEDLKTKNYLNNDPKNKILILRRRRRLK